MKYFISLLFAIAAISIAAQAPYKVYCTLQGNEKNFHNNQVSLRIDYGQKSLKDNKLVDENGDEIKFDTMVSAMNYMSKLGWNYEGCYNSEDQNGGGLIFIWILSKEVTSDDEITQGFQTKRMLKKRQGK